MENIERLQQEIEEIKIRNNKVEADKAWETSNSRKVMIAICTYLIIASFFYVTGLGNPFINAIVPTLGFLLSTISISVLKNLWIKKIYKK